VGLKEARRQEIFSLAVVTGQIFVAAKKTMKKKGKNNFSAKLYIVCILKHTRTGARGLNHAKGHYVYNPDMTPLPDSEGVPSPTGHTL